MKSWHSFLLRMKRKTRSMRRQRPRQGNFIQSNSRCLSGIPRNILYQIQQRIGTATTIYFLNPVEWNRIELVSSQLKSRSQHPFLKLFLYFFSHNHHSYLLIIVWLIVLLSIHCQSFFGEKKKKRYSLLRLLVKKCWQPKSVDNNVINTYRKISTCAACTRAKRRLFFQDQIIWIS